MTMIHTGGERPYSAGGPGKPIGTSDRKPGSGHIERPHGSRCTFLKGCSMARSITVGLLPAVLLTSLLSATAHSEQSPEEIRVHALIGTMENGKGKAVAEVQ